MGKRMPAVQGTAKGSRTLIEMFQRRVERSRGQPALRHKSGQKWRSLSWGDWDRCATEIAAGLLDLGLQPGDRVALLAQTRLEWALCDAGALMAGAVVVPIYPSSLPDQIEYIVRDSGSVLVIAEDPGQLDKLLAARSDLSHVEKVVLMPDRADGDDRSGAIALADVLPERSPGREWVVAMEELRRRGRAFIERAPRRLAAIADALDPDQAATIIYTSGTTGPPKGVILTHANLVFECAAVEELLELGEEDEHLLFLPLAHSLARSVLWAGVAIGFTTSVAESIARLVPNLGETRPTVLVAVPRVLEKAHARAQSGLDAARGHWLRRRVVDWALARGRERAQGRQNGGAAGRLQDRVADALVFDKMRGAFGGRLRYLISGGAPLGADIAQFFHAAGIAVLEGYGLTETCGAATCNRPESVRFGSVGQPLAGVELRIADDGEILVRGGNVMKGYHNQPEATAEVLDSGGWLRSGDVGRIDEQGHLYITDRKKDIIVTAGGKNVAPQNIENELKALCPLVSQAVVVGDRRKYLVALITLGEETAHEWVASGRLAVPPEAADDMAALSRHPQAVETIQRHLDQLNQRLASHEAIKRFTILPADFTQESGELTPSLKVKRKACVDKYRAEIDRLYREERSPQPVSREAPA